MRCFVYMTYFFIFTKFQFIPSKYEAKTWYYKRNHVDKRGCCSVFKIVLFKKKNPNRSTHTHTHTYTHTHTHNDVIQEGLHMQASFQTFSPKSIISIILADFKAQTYFKVWLKDYQL